MLEKIKREPVLVTTFCTSVAVVLVQFGVPVNDGVADAVSAAIIAGAALFTRSKVTPADAVE